MKKTKKARPRKSRGRRPPRSAPQKRKSTRSFSWINWSSPRNRISLKNRSLFKSPPKSQKVNEFLKKNIKYIPHAVGAAGLAYVLAKAYKTDPVYFKVLRVGVLNGVDVFRELNIPRSSTAAEVKAIIRKCLLTSHPDKNRGIQGRHFALCEELYKII